MIGENLRKIRKKFGLNQAGLAKIIGISGGYVSDIERRNLMPSEVVLRSIENVLGVNRKYLLEGNGEMITDRGPTSIPISGPYAGESIHENPDIPLSPEWAEFVDRHSPRLVPLISWVKAGEWSEVEDPFNPGNADKWFSTTSTRNPHAFALTIIGDSMEPEFKEGEIIIVDPGRQAENGDFVIAKNGDEATFKKLFIDGEKVYLVPLNERYENRDMTGVNFRIVGVIVQKIRNYGR